MSWLQESAVSRQIEQALNTLGFDVGSVDGERDDDNDDTADAVGRCQRSMRSRAEGHANHSSTTGSTAASFALSFPRQLAVKQKQGK